MCARTRTIHGECGYALNFAADFYTAQTADTLAHIANHAVHGVVKKAVRRKTGSKTIAGKSHILTKILQFAVSVSGTGYAVLIMVGKDKFYLKALHIAYSGRAGIHFHAFLQGSIAGGDDIRMTVCIHCFRKAYAAGAGFMV
jgi:hypothetical protein